MKILILIALTILATVAGAASTNCPATVTGWATWYSTNSCKADDIIRGVPPRTEFRTASGRLLDDSALSCALPLETARAWNIRYGASVRVTNLATSRTVIVTYLDRGPGRLARSRKVIVDLSVAGMLALAGEGGIEAGRVKVKMEVVK